MGEERSPTTEVDADDEDEILGPRTVTLSRVTGYRKQRVWRLECTGPVGGALIARGATTDDEFEAQGWWLLGAGEQLSVLLGAAFNIVGLPPHPAAKPA